MYKHPVALITGASRGIGKAIASALALTGHKTVLIARSKEQLRLAAFDIKNTLKLNDDLTPDICVLDITSQNDAAKTLKEVISTYGRMDVFVNNAGIWQGGSIDISLAKMREMFNVNLFAPYMFLQMIVPLMKKQKHGYIFNIASRAGKTGFAGSGSYCASKFALTGLNESLYRELVPLGIKVTALCPGWVNTQMAEKANIDLPLDKMIQPADIARTVKYLMELSVHACVKEIVLECAQSIA